MKSILLKLSIPLFVFSIFLVYGCSSQAQENHTDNFSLKKLSAITENEVDSKYHNGDIIFQTSLSGQSRAIQLATHSIYSHCGLLLNDDGKWFVYEAIQPVQKTPVNEWIARGDSGIFVVKRLKDADSLLTQNAITKMRKSVNDKMGKDYDLWFGWSDERIYCSELVWKAYHDATGLEVGKLKKLGEFDLTAPAVKEILEERYGKKIPLEEPMISPGNIFESDLLITVKRNK